jgi:hypothetical protein
MFFPQNIYIGIDPTAGNKPIIYAAVDQELQMVALGGGDMDEVLAFVGGQRQAVVSICAPQGPNLGLMADESFRQTLSPPPKPGRWKNYRVAEYYLRKHNIHITPTPSLVNACPGWIRTGFAIIRRITSLAYQPFSQSDSSLQYLEVYPQASYAMLLGHNPFLKHSLEGRLQRQLVLYERNINLPDPMNFFEEITRHRILNGVLPSGILHQPAELDALVGAYCAWLVKNRPDQVAWVGDPQEGQIMLPGVELKNRY